jgi:hypothetical protein
MITAFGYLDPLNEPHIRGHAPGAALATQIADSVPQYVTAAGFVPQERCRGGR